MSNKLLKEKLTHPLFNLTVEEFMELNRSVNRSSMEELLSKLKTGSEYTEKVLSRIEIAQLLGVSTEKVSDMVKRKEIPGTKRGRKYFFLKSAVLKALQKEKNDQR